MWISEYGAIPDLPIWPLSRLLKIPTHTIRDHWETMKGALVPAERVNHWTISDLRNLYCRANAEKELIERHHASGPH